jgi:glycosyltransferase involved in cell wall biosynthesis
MQNNPLVSIQILTYNHENFIIECLDSVLSQDYKNIEIIIGDDASTDNTQEILLEYKKKYSDIINLVLHKKNIGITNNCNSILPLCKGELICLTGGDDMFLPNKLSTQVQYLIEHKECTMSYHNMEVFQSETNRILHLFNDIHEPKNGTVVDVIKDGTFFSASSVMFRGSHTPINGYDSRIPRASDWLFCVEVLCNGGEIHYIDKIFGRYRRHNNNVTGTKINKDFMTQIDILNSCNILLIKAPQYQKAVMYRYSEVLRQMRLADEAHFIDYVKSSFKVGFNIKSLISYVLYIISFGRVRR